jgi:hypothetical protein
MIGEKRDLLVTVKSKNPRCFKAVSSLPVDYYSNADAWIICIIFNNLLVKWDLELKQKVVLLVDSCTTYEQLVNKEHQSDLLACKHNIVNSAM